nr:nucleotidyl transferase AbiEii/AbiGii toxin family protein [Armatimonadota bacterium]
VVYLPQSVKGERLRPDEEYHGLRIHLVAMMDKSTFPLQIDIGYGDAVHSSLDVTSMPTLLDDSPVPQVRMYPREAVVAEKTHAMVTLGLSNTRFKDFFDIWFLANHFDFDGSLLSAAMTATFERRNTEIPANTPVALTPEFTNDTGRQGMWSSFARKIQWPVAQVPSLSTITEHIADFLMPPLRAAQMKQPFQQAWSHGASHWAS